ncbi:hypothetical protein SAMN02745866_00845 [Alteromonadaceae bacterium Bs31]|nr:hypothetical protein SAMN02745866_00845 [Alteromonadaceae bacterium Bs31]
MSRSKFAVLLVAFGIISPLNALAACDCGSTNSASPCTGSDINVSVTSSSKTITINWGFNSGGEDAYCGQFANGDYWVAPKAGKSLVISQISKSGGYGGDISADINPTTENHGLLDGSNGYGGYKSSEDITGNLPLTITSGGHMLPVRFNAGTDINSAASIVAAVQKSETDTDFCGTKQILGECAEVYNVLTVLSAVPPENGSMMLRPNMSGSSKDLVSLDDLELQKIPSFNAFNGYSSDQAANAVKRWNHHTEVFSLCTLEGKYFSEGGRAYRAHFVSANYAAGVAQSWYNDMASLMSGENSAQEQQKILAAMLSYGLDIYKAVYNDEGENYHYYCSGAGQFLGKFMPPAFLAALSSNSTYRETLKKETERVVGTGYGPNEIEQVKEGPDGRLVWGDGAAGLLNPQDVKRYWTELFKGQCYDGASGGCNSNVGKKTTRDPYGYIDGPPARPGSSYASVVLGPQKSMVAMMFAMPEICEAINSQNLIKYVLRVVRHGVWTQGDKCAPPDPRESSDCDVWENGENCKYYRVTWGPKPDDLHQCIENGPGQNGRYPQLDGAELGVGYKSTQIERAWDEVVGNKNTCPLANRPTAPAEVKVKEGA